MDTLNKALMTLRPSADRRTLDGALVYARGQLELFRELTGQAGGRDA